MSQLRSPWQGARLRRGLEANVQLPAFAQPRPAPAGRAPLWGGQTRIAFLTEGVGEGEGTGCPRSAVPRGRRRYFFLFIPAAGRRSPGPRHGKSPTARRCRVVPWRPVAARQKSSSLGQRQSRATFVLRGALHSPTASRRGGSHGGKIGCMPRPGLSLQCSQWSLFVASKLRVGGTPRPGLWRPCRTRRRCARAGERDSAHESAGAHSWKRWALSSKWHPNSAIRPLIPCAPAPPPRPSRSAPCRPPCRAPRSARRAGRSRRRPGGASQAAPSGAATTPSQRRGWRG